MKFIAVLGVIVGLAQCFQLRVVSDDRAVNNLNVEPVPHANVFYAFTSKHAAKGSFEIVNDSLGYKDGANSSPVLASVGTKTPYDVPIVEFGTQHKHSSGFHLDKSGSLNFGEFIDPWWVCPVSDGWAVTLWQYTVDIYPPPQDTKGCKSVKLVAELF